MKRSIRMMALMLAVSIVWWAAGAGGAAQQAGGCAMPRSAAARNFAAGEVPLSVTTGDFNSNSKPDLATANIYSSKTSVLLGDGAGGFSPVVRFGEGDQSFALAAGDFNRDGRLDLATANVFSDNVSVLLNTCGAG